MKSMGQKIRLLRISAGLSQVQLAEEIGVNTKSIQRYETENSRPDTYVLTRLAAFFDHPPKGLTVRNIDQGIPSAMDFAVAQKEAAQTKGTILARSLQLINACGSLCWEP